MSTQVPDKTHATGVITVRIYEPVAYEEPAEGPVLTRIHVEETFSGDITGAGVVEFLQSAGADGSASFVGIERVTGTLAGRQGSFLLQDNGTVEGELVSGSWFVVPDSGTAARLRLPQPRVSRLVATLERRVGGTLFERTSRSVRLTPAGEQLRDELRPAYSQVQAALSRAKDAARQAAGVVRMGFTATSCCAAVTRATGAFEADNPGCHAVLREVELFEPYAALRRCEVDVLFNWLAIDEPDLSTGPAIDYRDRVLLAAPDHPLGGRESVCQEELGNWDMVMCPPSDQPPDHPTRRVHQANTIQEIVTLVSLGRVVHPTCTSVPMYQRDDIVQIPIRDVPPVAIGPIWCTAHENARIRALVQASRTVRPGALA